MGFGGILVGKIFDDNGPSFLLLAGTFLHVNGLLFTSLANSYISILLSQGVVSAIGASCIAYPALSCVSVFYATGRSVH
jgi:hypothetical protein